MSTNFQDLDPNSPEYEKALMEAQAAEDEANGNVELEEADDETEGESTDETDAEPATEAEPAAVEGKQEAAPAPIAGVASKDGSRVLPYAALKAERRAARQAANRAERAERELAAAKQQLEDIKAGKAPAKDDADISDEELAELEQDFPQVAKVARIAREAKREAEQIKAKHQPAADEDTGTDEDPVQEAIDTVPLLSEWQAADQEKFKRAIELDNAVRNSPKWKDKPLSARFAHVARLVADEFDLEVPEDTKPQQQAKTPSKPDPKTVIAQAKRAAPNTLSDLKAGVADPTEERVERMSPAKQVAQFSRMTDAQITAHLRKLG